MSGCLKAPWVTGLKTRQSLWGSSNGTTWTEHARTAYEHLPSGQLWKHVRPRSASDLDPSVEEITCDAAGRATQVEVEDGPTTELLEFEYFAGGRRRLARATPGAAR